MGIIFKGFSEWKVKKLLYKSAVQTTLLEQLGGADSLRLKVFGPQLHSAPVREGSTAIFVL